MVSAFAFKRGYASVPRHVGLIEIRNGLTMGIYTKLQLMANFRPTWVRANKQLVQLEVGGVVLALRGFASDIQITRGTLKRHLRWLEDNGFLTVSSHREGTIIRLKQYGVKSPIPTPPPRPEPPAPVSRTVVIGVPKAGRSFFNQMDPHGSKCAPPVNSLYKDLINNKKFSSGQRSAGGRFMDRVPIREGEGVGGLRQPSVIETQHMLAQRFKDVPATGGVIPEVARKFLDSIRGERLGDIVPSLRPNLF